MAAVKYFNSNFMYVDGPTQTEAMCLLAVRNDGNMLGYVKNKTEKICLEAVKENGLALACVESQTEDVCLAAVGQNGFALEYVKSQTEEICLAAVERQGFALQYVKNQNKEIIKEALKSNILSFIYVENDIYEYKHEDIKNLFKSICDCEFADASDRYLNLKKTAEILNRLGDEELIKAVKNEVAFLFENNLYKCEELTAIKQKVEMLLVVGDKNNIDSGINAVKIKRKVL